MERRQPLLHRLGEAGARFGTKPPRSKGVRLALQIGLAVVVFGFLVLTVIDQWSEIQSEGVHFHVLWLIPALIILPFYFVFSAFGWDLILRSLGYRIGFGRAQVAWGQPLLARYVPGSILYVLGPGAALGAGRGAAPHLGRLDRLRTGDLGHLGDRRRRLLHHQAPRSPGRAGALGGAAADPGWRSSSSRRSVFGPLSNQALRAFGRDPLPVVMSLRDVIALIVYYSLNWLLIAFGIYSVARSVTYIPYSDILLVGSAQAIGYFAALVTLVAPAGLGVRDAAFAWAVKAALPGRSFAVGSLISIAVRGVMTVAELIYVGAVTAIGRREGWSIHTGILHPSPEEAGERRPRKPAPTPPKSSERRHLRRIARNATALERDAGAELVGGEGEEEGGEDGGRGRRRRAAAARAGTRGGARRWRGGGRSRPRRRRGSSRRRARSGPGARRPRRRRAPAPPPAPRPRRCR